MIQFLMLMFTCGTNDSLVEGKLNTEAAIILAAQSSLKWLPQNVFDIGFEKETERRDYCTQSERRKVF